MERQALALYQMNFVFLFFLFFETVTVTVQYFSQPFPIVDHRQRHILAIKSFKVTSSCQVFHVNQSFWVYERTETEMPRCVI